MRTATLNDIVRQRDPELKQVVEQLARGQVGAAVESLDQQGRVHPVRGHDERIAAIAREYASLPAAHLLFRPTTVLVTRSINGYMMSCNRADL